MVLIDTSIWIDHLRTGDSIVTGLLLDGCALVHPWIIGELALGTSRDRAAMLRDLCKLDTAIVATDAELFRFIEDHGLSGTGVGYIDAGLLASTKLTPDASLMTRDKRLRSVAERLGVSARLTH